MGNADRMLDKFAAATATEDASLPRPYSAPSIRTMDEKEVLSSFQVTVAAISWWVM